LEEHFGGPSGVVFASAADASHLVVRPSDQQDNPSPSGASLAAECYLLLGHLTGDHRYHEGFEQIVRAGDRLLDAAPSAAGHLLAVLATSQMGIREVAVTGPGALEWAGRLAGTYRPDLVVAPSPGHDEEVPLVAGRYREGETLGYVCERGACRMPVGSYGELSAQVASKG